MVVSFVDSKCAIKSFALLFRAIQTVQLRSASSLYSIPKTSLMRLNEMCLRHVRKPETENAECDRRFNRGNVLFLNVFDQPLPESRCRVT